MLIRGMSWNISFQIPGQKLEQDKEPLHDFFPERIFGVIEAGVGSTKYQELDISSNNGTN